MKILDDITLFLENLSFVDIVFFVAIIVLLILIVTLIYFIKINKDVLGPDDFFPDLVSDDKIEEKEENVEQIKTEESKEKSEEEYNDEEGELLDLKSLTEKLANAEKHEDGILEYEKDQEEKAIISYDELLQKKNKYAINYEKEEVLDDLVVKKVDLNDLVNKDVIEEIKEVRVISYEKEEAFLNALKELNKLLN